MARGVLAALMAALPAGCNGDHGDTVRVAVVGKGGNADDLAGKLARASVNDGLVGLDADGKVVPALAERWIVTDGGQTYIFRLRVGQWSDGSTITPDSVRTALRGAAEGAGDSDLGPDLDALDEVRAMAARVVEIRLKWPVSDFLQVLAQPEMGLTRRGKGAGPMSLRSQDGVTELSVRAPDRDAEAEGDRLRAMRITRATSAEAVAAFSAGKADVVLGGTFADVPGGGRLALGKIQPRLDPAVGLFGLAVLRQDGLLATPTLREAIAMSIDRESLAASMPDPVWTATSRFVAPGLEGDPGLIGERWTDLDLDGRRTLAMRAITNWQTASHKQPALTIALPKGPGADVLFDRITSDMTNIGVKLVRVEAKDHPDLALIDVVARYARPLWFLHALSCRVRPAICNAQADDLVHQAVLASPDVGGPLLGEAERRLTDANLYIPLGRPIRWSLVSGDLGGFAVNKLAVHPLLPLATRAR